MKDQVVDATANDCVFVIPETVIAFNANAEVTANDEVVAIEAVPNNDPVNPKDELTPPVIV